MALSFRYLICLALLALAAWMFKTAAALFLAVHRLGAVSNAKTIEATAIAFTVFADTFGRCGISRTSMVFNAVGLV